MRLSILAVVLAASVVTGAAGAQTAPSVAPHANATYPIAVDLPAGAYRLDPRHASVLFRIRHEGLSWFTARFDGKDATLGKHWSIIQQKTRANCSA